MTDVNKTLQEKKIETYGFDVTEVTKYISEDMADRFAKATENLDDEKNMVFIQACYNVLMQMKSVTSSGKAEINDGAILDTYNLLMSQMSE